MKRITLALLLACIIFSTSQAQNLLDKVPSTASVAIKYSGDNFGKNVPLKKLDSYSFIKDNFFKMLHIDTLASMQNMGIDFEQDAYQYVTMEDSAMSFVTLVHLKDATQFIALIKASYGTAGKTETKSGFQFITLSATNYVAWNQATAVIVYTNYQHKESYYTNHQYYEIIDSLKPASDSSIITIDTLQYAVPEVKQKDVVKENKSGHVIKPGKSNSKSKTVVTAKNKKKTPVKKAPQKKQEEVEDEVAAKLDPVQAARDSIANRKRDLWDQQQDMIAKAKQYAEAEKIATNTFINTVYSIENEPSYKKIIDPAAHVSIWINAETLSKQYWSYLSGSVYGIMHQKINYVKDTADGFKSAVNIYFDKDKVRMEQKTFSANPLLAGMGKDVMNSKQNASMANYVNPDNIGYFSMSINTEAMENYNYRIIKNYLSNAPYVGEYADIVDVYVDLLQIVIDEKAIAELAPGNFLFVLHDMKTKMVSYTDYSYDSSYNRTEIKKEKKEMSPNFTFIMETKREDFMQKIAHLPVKYADKEKYNYKDKGGYYELAFDSGKYAISSLYFMVKDNKAIVTTSKDVIDMTLNGTGFPVDADTKKSILNNNYSLKINTKNLLQQMSSEFNTGVTKKVSNYLMENLGDFKMESSIKDGIIQSTSTMGIKGNHANSLEFFFNMIDAINNIMEKDKQEGEKKIN